MPWCNSGKKDYHPDHKQRVRLPRESHGFGVIDIREEDFAEMFTIKIDGALGAKYVEQKERIKFNVVKLLRLNEKRYKKQRLEFIEYLELCEDLLASNDSSKETQRSTKTLVKLVAERYLFYKAFNIEISNDLMELIKSYIVKHKPKLIK